MTVKDALEFLVLNETECENYSCVYCPVKDRANELGYHDRYNCTDCAHASAEIVRKWLESLPEGRLSDVTIEDLL